MGPVLMIVGWLLFIPATAILRLRVTRPRTPGDQQRTCPGCGYDRAGLADAAPCSECGLTLGPATIRANQRTMLRRWTLYAGMTAAILLLYAAGVTALHIAQGERASLARWAMSCVVACLLLGPVAGVAPLYVRAFDSGRLRLSAPAAWCLAVSIVLGASVGAIWCAWDSLSLPPRAYGRGLAMVAVALPASGGADFGAFLAAVALGILGDWDETPAAPGRNGPTAPTP